jgi:electron transport complex protein RnfE
MVRTANSVLVDNNISIMTMAPGGFFVFGCLIALVNKVSNGRAIKKKEFGCEGCPSAAACGKISCEKGGAEE